MSACGSGSPSGRGRILLAYFSRPGENYWYGGRRDLEVGNTEVLARMISARLDCDVHRIEAVDRYPADYEETVQRNVREQEADARPAIADPLPSIDGYDTILLASPIWNVRAPMIMTTFAESLRLLGQDRPPGHDVRHERPRHDSRRLRAVVQGRTHRHRACGARREGPVRRRRPSTHGCAAPASV